MVEAAGALLTHGDTLAETAFASHEIATGPLQVEPDAQEVNSTMQTPDLPPAQ